MNKANNQQKLKKIKKKNIKLFLEENEKDEDKIIIKEKSIIRSFSPKEKSAILKDKMYKSFRSWNNQLLKNILPKNIKNYYEYQEQKEIDINTNNSHFNETKVMYFRNEGYKTLSCINNDKNKYLGKYKKLKMMMLNKDKKNYNDNTIITSYKDKNSIHHLSRSTLVC